MLLILGFSLVAVLAWLTATGYWDRNGDMIKGCAIALVVVIHVIALIAALLGSGAYVGWTDR